MLTFGQSIYIQKKTQLLKVNLLYFTMLASDGKPSRISPGIFFEQLSRLAEELQNITLEDPVIYKE